MFIFQDLTTSTDSSESKQSFEMVDVPLSQSLTEETNKLVPQEVVDQLTWQLQEMQTKEADRVTKIQEMRKDVQNKEKQLQDLVLAMEQQNKENKRMREHTHRLEIEKRDLTAMNNQLTAQMSNSRRSPTLDSQETCSSTTVFDREEYILVGAGKASGSTHGRHNETARTEQSMDASIPGARAAPPGASMQQSIVGAEAAKTREGRIVSDLLVQLQEEREKVTSLIGSVKNLEALVSQETKTFTKILHFFLTWCVKTKRKRIPVSTSNTIICFS